MKLTPQQEQFAQYVALGMTQADAYRKAMKSKASDKTIWEKASRLAGKVEARVAELQAAAKQKATAKYVYEYEDAMREADEALAIARQKNDPKAMASIIALKGKFSGLETEARRNERPPFEGMTDDELVDLVNRNMEEAGLATLQ